MNNINQLLDQVKDRKPSIDIKNLRNNSILQAEIDLNLLSDEQIIASYPEIAFFLESYEQNFNILPHLQLTNGKIEIIYADNPKYLEKLSASQLSNKLKLLYIPESFRQASLNDWQEEDYLLSKDNANLFFDVESTRNLVKKDQITKGMYIYGSFGVGKTHLLAALSNVFLQNNKTVIICFWPEVVNYLKTHFDQSYDYMQMLKDVDVLMIDDIGAESLSNYIRDDIILPLLQYRMNFNKLTYFSSNLTLEQLESHFMMTANGQDSVKAKRIIERIMAMTNVRKLDGNNKRK